MEQNALFLESVEEIIGSTTTLEDAISALDRHGCLDRTSSIDQSSCSSYPVRGGGFCEVYTGTLLHDIESYTGTLPRGTKVAIKSLRVYETQEGVVDGQKAIKRAARELYLWSKLHHPNVLPLLGLARFRGYMSMISEWMDNGSLITYIKRHPRTNRIDLCMDICAGLCYIHAQGMTHGDLKAGNVMISPNGNAMITDFGNSTLREVSLNFTDTKSYSLSIRYTAPEILLIDKGARHVSREADVYAYGMTALEALTGKAPFEGVHELRVVGLVAYEHQIPSREQTNISNDIWAILVSCWAVEPSERPDIAAVETQLRASDVLHFVPNDTA